MLCRDEHSISLFLARSKDLVALWFVGNRFVALAEVGVIVVKVRVKTIEDATARVDSVQEIVIEGKVALEIARSMIRPVVADEFSRLATAIGQARKGGLKVGLRGLNALSLKLGAGLDDLHVKCEHVEKAVEKGEPSGIIAAMDDLRRTVDRLELLVDDGRWPLPKYREMLFVY